MQKRTSIHVNHMDMHNTKRAAADAVLALIFPGQKATNDPGWAEATALWYALVAPRTPSAEWRLIAGQISAGHILQSPNDRYWHFSEIAVMSVNVCLPEKTRRRV